MDTVEVAVIGAGAAGLATAWRLAVAGREVAVLERFEVGNERGSSHGATRIFRFAYDDPVYVRLAQAALPLWRELEATAGEEILRVTGGLDVGPGARLDAIETALRSCGASAERLAPADRRNRFPWLDAGEEPALFSPDTGVLAGARALEAMAAAARTAGARIDEHRCVTTLVPHEDGITVATDAGPLRANRCVVAAGAWASSLLHPAGMHLPTRVTREQVFYFRGSHGIVPIIDHGEITRYAVPAFAGAAGVKVAEHGTGERTSGDGRSYEMDPEGEARVASYVARTLPSLDAAPVAFETCLYTTTPDEGFVLDVHGPVVIASACSGHGFKFAPILGEILACLATGREPPLDLGAFSAARFGPASLGEAT